MHVVTAITPISIPEFLAVVLPAVILSVVVVTSGHPALQPTIDTHNHKQQQSALLHALIDSSCLVT